LNDDLDIKSFKIISDDVSSFSGTLTDDAVMQFGASAGALGDFNDDGFLDVIV